MSHTLYNMIMMDSDPEFWSGDAGCVEFPRDRFLEYTADDLKNQFQSLDQKAINRLKKLPTLFAVEQERVDTRIGKITDIEVEVQLQGQRILRVSYQFSKDHYPLTKGILQQNWQELNINKPGLEFYRTHWAIKKCDISVFYKKYLKTLTGIAYQLKDSKKKVQLIYAFNGSGKTRLSRTFKDLIAPKNDEGDEAEPSRTKILYYNAFTEDLFYWDNDLAKDSEPRLKIQPNSFTDWILKDQGQDRNIITNFQRYTNQTLTPRFNEAFTEVTFSLEGGDDQHSGDLKISKGEESSFIWSIFYSLLDQVINILNVSETSERETDQFNQLKYVFIDDPVTSRDENHSIELAVNMAGLIKSSEPGLRFVITTHSPLFYNVLYSELKPSSGYILSKFDDGSLALEEKKGAANKAFAYHLHIKQLIEQAIEQNNVQRYHFTLLRNLYEKIAAFFGYKEWADLLNKVEGDKKAYFNRIIQFSSHSILSGEEIAEPTEPEKQTVKLLLDNLNSYDIWPKQEEQNG